MQVSKESLPYSLETIPSVPLHKYVFSIAIYNRDWCLMNHIQWRYHGINTITNAKNISGPRHSTTVTVTKCRGSMHVKVVMLHGCWYSVPFGMYANKYQCAFTTTEKVMYLATDSNTSFT